MSDRHDRFNEIYHDYSGLILAHALRRTSSAADAGDVVAEVFTVAWRRMDDVPDGEEARPWLYGVARRVLANHHRAERRRRRLAARSATAIADVALDAVRPVVAGPDAAAIRAALDSMSDGDRELLLLVGWDRLGRGDIATMLGTSRATVRVRLHRARRRFARALAAHAVKRTEGSGHGAGGWATVHLDSEDRG